MVAAGGAIGGMRGSWGVGQDCDRLHGGVSRTDTYIVACEKDDCSSWLVNLPLVGRSCDRIIGVNPLRTCDREFVIASLQLASELASELDSNAVAKFH